MKESTVRVILFLGLALALSFLAFGGPVQDIGASPLGQQAMQSVWINQTIPTTGVYGCVESGTSKEWTAFLHIDAPSAADSYTMTIYQRAIVGTAIYTGPVEIEYSVHDFSTAQNYMTYTTYSGGEIWPSHCVKVNSRNASLTGHLLWLQGR